MRALLLLIAIIAPQIIASETEKNELKSQITYLLFYKNKDTEMVKNSLQKIENLQASSPSDPYLLILKNSFLCAKARDTINLFLAKECISGLKSTNLTEMKSHPQYKDAMMIKATVLATFPSFLNAAESATEEYKILVSQKDFEEMTSSDKAIIYSYYSFGNLLLDQDSQADAHQKKAELYDKSIANKIQKINN